MTLGQVCTVKTSRFYIPGETTISERLRKASFDCGIFTLLYYVVLKVSDRQKEFAELKLHIREKVLQFLELNELQYHAKVLSCLL